MTCFLSPYFNAHTTCHFPNFSYICPENAGNVILQNLGTLIPYCMVLWTWGPQYICWWNCSRFYQWSFRDYVLSNHIQPLWLGPKTNTYQVLSYQIVGKVLHYACPNVSDCLIRLHLENCCRNSKKILSGVLKPESLSGRKWTTMMHSLFGPSHFVSKDLPLKYK